MSAKLILKAKELAAEIKRIVDDNEGQQVVGEKATKVTDLQTELNETITLIDGVKLADSVIEFADAPAGGHVKHLTPEGEQMHRKLSDLLPGWDEYKTFAPVAGSFDTKTLFDGTPAADAVPDYGPMALMPKEELLARSLFGSGTTGSDTAKYLKQTLRTNAADFVSPTGEYPESAFTFEWQTDTVAKIGHMIPVSEDTLADRGQMASILDGEMTYGVAYKIDRALFQANESDFKGLLNRTGVQAFTSSDSGYQLGVADGVNSAGQETTYFDIIRRLAFAASNGTAVGFKPDACCIDPTIAQYIDLVKDTTGRYLMYVQNGQIWRLNVVETRALTVSTTHHIVVGAFKLGAQVLSRRGTNVEVGYVNDQFIHDTKTIKASERLLMKVPYPVAFADWSITDAELAVVS